MARPKQRVLSGMRPSGRVHLGNYLGALANWVKLQETLDCYYFVADWHALTDDLNTSDVPGNTVEMLADWLGAGLDPERSTLFIQSLVPEHAEPPGEPPEHAVDGEARRARGIGPPGHPGAL